MPQTIEQIVEQTRQMPEDTRAELVERIVVSAHGGIAPHVEEAWKQETRRRLAEARSGTAREMPLDEALEIARNRAGVGRRTG